MQEWSHMGDWGAEELHRERGKRELSPKQENTNRRARPDSGAGNTGQTSQSVTDRPG